jgi:hypothetical protein
MMGRATKRMAEPVWLQLVSECITRVLRRRSGKVFVAFATLVIVAAGPSYAEPLRSTSIPSSLANDEKRLLPEVMDQFYGTFDKAKACWTSTKSGPHPVPGSHMWGDSQNAVNEDITYCMKPIRLDVVKSAGRKMLFVVVGGNFLEDGQPETSDPAAGLLGLIVLTPNGAKLGVVGTNDLYEGYESYGGYPQHDTVTVRKLGPNGTYGWVARLGYQHSGYEYEWVQVYGVVGNSVKFLTGFVTYYSDEGACPEVGCSTLSAKYTFDTHSSASSFYPIMLQVSGVEKGRSFHGNYRLVFDDKSLKYVRPENVPDEIMPRVERTSESVRHDRPCDVAQDHPEKFNWNPGGGNAIMFGGCREIEDTPDTSRAQHWGAINCGYFAYRQNKTRDANPYSNKDSKEGWTLGWDAAAKACNSGKLPFSEP